MAAALRLALAQESDSERLRQVVFLTDGAVGNEDELFGIIRAQLGSRIAVSPCCTHTSHRC